MNHTIVIVGGVAAGASAATRARRCNEHARIILFEKDEHVSFANCGLPYYIGGEIADRGKLLVATPEFLRQRFNIDVRTRHEALAIDRSGKLLRVRNRQTGEEFEQAYDKLILAPGAAPIVPPLPGIDAGNVFTLRNLADTDRIHTFLAQRRTGRAVVVGAGFIGLEMVEMLHKRGLKIALVERNPQVLPPLDPEMAKLVEASLKRHEVELHLNNGLAGFELEGNLVRRVNLADGTALEADIVIVGVGVKPAVKLAQEAGLTLGSTGGIVVDEYLRSSDADIYAVGDAVEYRHAVADMLMRVPLAGPANRAGRLAGEHAATGKSAAMPAVLGTAIVRVFDTVAAVTGCNLRCVATLKGQSHSVHVRHNHHAGYYPGAEPMTLKLLYHPTTRRVLGAQAVGGQGVDKRIDVIATAISLGATVDQLTQLDLAYAPMFGSAKDPVHMLAFAAQNELEGRVEFVPPDVDFDGHQVLDVRTPAEVARYSLPGAVTIPLDELRDRVGELDPSRRTLVMCQSGQRAYAAARILRAHGFSDVADVSGGAFLRQFVISQ